MSWVAGDPARSSASSLRQALAGWLAGSFRVQSIDLAGRLAAASDRLEPRARGALVRALVEARAGTNASAVATALCLFVAVLQLGDADDFVAVRRFADDLDPARAAAALVDAGRRLDGDTARPLTAALVRALGRRADVRTALLEADSPPAEEAVDAVVARSFEVAMWLLMTDLDQVAPGGPITSVEEAEALCAEPDLTAWQGQVALIVANPWSPYAGQLQRVLEAAGRSEAADAVADFIGMYRARVERHERMEVARFVRRAVEGSGLLQRDFAMLVGTSASRLSTYMNGSVTPSAAMMLRIGRVARQIEESNDR